jgi:proteasome lid subunit RPN8/RPN11
VTLAGGVLAAILDHARQSAPHECCGLLIGDATRITSAVRARNIADEPTRRYRVDPHDHIAAIRLARHRNELVVGAYHSHPRSHAVPSATDAAEAFPDFVFLIVGLASDPPDVRAWTWAEGNFALVALVRDP